MKFYVGIFMIICVQSGTVLADSTTVYKQSLQLSKGFDWFYEATGTAFWRLAYQAPVSAHARNEIHVQFSQYRLLTTNIVRSQYNGDTGFREDNINNRYSNLQMGIGRNTDFSINPFLKLRLGWNAGLTIGQSHYLLIQREFELYKQQPELNYKLDQRWYGLFLGGDIGLLCPVSKQMQVGFFYLPCLTRNRITRDAYNSKSAPKTYTIFFNQYKFWYSRTGISLVYQFGK